ncbi:hypothetical protein UlMin_026682 [Ulmus minor]
MATYKTPKPSPNTSISAPSQPSNSSPIQNRAKSTSNSLQMVANNDDLLIQILLKLPIKSLSKFKSVSKHWLSLISDPQFSRRRKPFSGLFLKPLNESSPWSIPEYDFVDLTQTFSPSFAPIRSLNFIKNNPFGITILHSCNGLFLCSTKQTLLDPTERYVYNPTTNKYTVLPLLPRRSGSVLALSLAFDPSKSAHYKVVCVWRWRGHANDNNNLIQIEVYSSETGTWRLSGGPFYSQNGTAFEDGVFWNGAVHWVCFGEPYLFFNVDEEQPSQMPLPPVPDELIGFKVLRYFGESRGHLHLIYFFFEPYPATHHFKVYELEMDYSRWFVKFWVDFSEFPVWFPEIIASRRNDQLLLEMMLPNEIPEIVGPSWKDYVFSIVHIVHGDVDEEWYVVIRIPGKVIRYNFMSKAFEKLCDIKAGRGGGNLNIFEYTHAHQYIESLALV